MLPPFQNVLKMFNELIRRIVGRNQLSRSPLVEEASVLTLLDGSRTTRNEGKVVVLIRPIRQLQDVSLWPHRLLIFTTRHPVGVHVVNTGQPDEAIALHIETLVLLRSDE